MAAERHNATKVFQLSRPQYPPTRIRCTNRVPGHLPTTISGPPPPPSPQTSCTHRHLNSKTRRPVDFRVSPTSDVQARGGPFLEPCHRLHHIEGMRSMMVARKARGGKEVSPSSSSRAAETRPRCMTTAFAHPAIQGGHRPCSVTYFGACITDDHPAWSQTTQPRPAEMACSISRAGSRHGTHCSSEALRVAYESGRRRPAR